MGYQELALKLPTDYTDEQLQRKIRKKLGIEAFTWQIERKSLDARKKNAIHWQLRVVVSSPELKGDAPQTAPILNVPARTRNYTSVVVGSGPAGFFAAFVLQKAGFAVTLIDRGAGVEKRAAGIREFERSGRFNPVCNYAFGEGGAGTFSDGKLTSRTKNITAEKDFMLQSYIKAGAPEEIGYMAHPHVGSDNLRRVVKNLRREFQSLGGAMQFETMLTDVIVKHSSVSGIVASTGEMPADELIIAGGHSAYETYRLLMRRGVAFRTKNFAIGYRVEHPQALINRAQWGRERLPGVKAAEYRLTSRAADRPVYTFCMCPGGTVVPATAYAERNIVNGMSLYRRDGAFANAACVAGVHPDELAGRTVSPAEALDRLADLEARFYEYSHSYLAPSCSIHDFMNEKESNATLRASYPLGVEPAPLWDMLPSPVVRAIRTGLLEFRQKLKGFEKGNLLGFESKTSAPIQTRRDRRGLCDGFENLYMVGEGSGWAGGIISSGVDGIRAAMRIIAKYE